MGWLSRWAKETPKQSATREIRINNIKARKVCRAERKSVRCSRTGRNRERENSKRKRLERDRDLRFSNSGRKINKGRKSRVCSSPPTTRGTMAFEEGLKEVEQEEFVYPIPVRQPVIDLTSSPPPLARSRTARLTGLFPGEGEGRKPVSLNKQDPTRQRTETTQRRGDSAGGIASGSGASGSYTRGNSSAQMPPPIPFNPSTSANPAPAQQYRPQQQSPQRRVDAGTNPGPNRFQATNFQQHDSNHVPIITSGASARIPSAYLPTASLSSTARDPISRVQSSMTRVVPNNTKGKGREVVDLTTSDGEEEDEIIVLNDDPICIGQISTLALILHCVAELAPPVAPIPPPSRDSSGRTIPPSAVATPSPRNNQLPVHLYRAPRSGNNETIKILTPGTKEIFGVMEHKTANVVASLLGDGYSGTGVTKGGNGKMWCLAAVLRRPEKDVRLACHSCSAHADVLTLDSH